MIDRLRQLAVFAKTVEHGSFRRAGEALRLSPSVVSHHISQLEQHLGTALLYRSTRRLSLTADGKLLAGKARAMIEEAEQGLYAISARAAQLSGSLRITVPAVLAQSELAGRLADFSTENPNVRLEIDFSDTRRPIIESGIDLAIRMGWLRDSSLRTRKLFEVERILVAAPSCTLSRPRPASPDDLQDWPWIELSPVRIQPAFTHDDGSHVVLKPDAKLTVNDAQALKHFAVNSAGLATLPVFLVEQAIADGDLVHVLPDWHLQSVGVHAVWPANAPKDGLTVRLVRLLADGAAR